MSSEKHLPIPRQQHRQQHQMPTIFRAFCLLLIAILFFHYHFGSLVPEAEAFIFWKAHSTACEEEICDGIDTNSGRNVACCFLFSKCCGYKTLDEAEAIRANLTGTTPAP